MTVSDRYSTLERALYRIAFRVGTAQHALSDVEDTLYADRLKRITAENPVFITALPRSGTTILLKLLCQTGRFASHTYRDMPFVLCPLIWNRYAEQFAGEVEPTERAHGDGLEVSGESPEAFEEMIWKHFWPEYYREDQIRPWRPGDNNEEFTSFFEVHMRKVIALRTEEADGEKNGGRRYLSKNNLNIARLAALPDPLRTGTIVIPFRDPIQQAASMHHQHQRFLQIHEEDDFVREYMEAIGHHEFGKGLKPVNFSGWIDTAPDLDPNTLSFWLRYWIAAYEHVLDHAGGDVVLISYRRLTEEPRSALSRLAEALDLAENSLTSQSDDLHSPRHHSVEPQKLPAPLLPEAKRLYEQLDRKANV